MEGLEIMLLLLLLTLLNVLTTSLSLVEESEVSCDRLKATDCGTLKSQRRSGTKTTIYFGLMLSFPDLQGRSSFASSFDDGHDIAPAAYLAVKQVNNQTDLLKDYDVEILRLDGGCDATTRTTIGANELICSCKSIIGIIGPSCKLSSKIVGHITNHKAFSMITINYGDQIFSDVDKYAYSFGILGASSMYSSVYNKLINHSNWENYALLYLGSSEIYSGISRELLNLTGSEFPPRYSSAIYNTFIPLREVKDSYVRVIIVIASPPTIARVLCLAYHEGMVFPSYQWVFQEILQQDLANVSFKYQGRPYSCSDKELNRSVRGSINLFSDAIQDDADVNATIDDTMYTLEYKYETDKYSKQFGVNATAREWARGFYDAVWALAYALNDSLVDLNMSLSEFKVGSPVLAEIIKNHMFDINFQGITGNINFDSKTGINIGGFLNIFQYTDRQTSEKIGYFKNGVLTISSTSSNIFIESSFKEEFITIEGYIVAFILVITLITLLLLIYVQTFNICHRNDKQIKASSPLLNHLIFIGGYAIVIGIIIHCLETVVHTTAQLQLCNLVPFLFSVGITLYLGTSCVKTWRLNRIYVYSRRFDVGDILFIKVHILVGFVSLLVVIDLLVCIVWRITDPLIPAQTPTLNAIGSEDEFVISVQTACHSNYEIYWYIALLTPKVIVLIASFFLALSTQMNIKEFKTNNIIILTYFLTVIFGLGIPLYAVSIITQNSVSVSTTLLSLTLNLTTYACIFILFLPLIINTGNHL
jgi:hypothetical protein